MLRRETVIVTGATGGTGSATASANTSNVVAGKVCAVYLEYTDSPPAGSTDVTIEEAGQSPALPVLTVTNAATDGWFYPDVATVGSDVAPVYVNDHLTVTIAGANNGDGVTATIVWMVK